jgi:hypothetical protein
MAPLKFGHIVVKFTMLFICSLNFTKKYIPYGIALLVPKLGYLLCN